MNEANLKKWRKETRAGLLQQRLGIKAEIRTNLEAEISRKIKTLLQDLNKLNLNFGFYWPCQGEFDPRAIASFFHDQGVILGLPVVRDRGAPLVFLQWTPNTAMTTGEYGIAIPEEGKKIVPHIVLVPTLGFDGQGYRLGYGAGYYDRTLAAMNPRPITIAPAFELSKIDTIYPQSHDIKMDFIVTEKNIYCSRDEQLVSLSSVDGLRFAPPILR